MLVNRSVVSEFSRMIITGCRFCACAVKYGKTPEMIPYVQVSTIIQEIDVVENNGVSKFLTRSGNFAISVRVPLESAENA